MKTSRKSQPHATSKWAYRAPGLLLVVGGLALLQAACSESSSDPALSEADELARQRARDSYDGSVQSAFDGGNSITDSSWQPGIDSGTQPRIDGGPTSKPDGGVAAVDASVPPATGEATDPSVNGVVLAHNAVRAGIVRPGGGALVPLQWSESDAQVARNWAAQCNYQHNSGRGNRGENIYASYGQTATPQVVTKSWASEVSGYNYQTNQCSGVCGHYTQIVWANTTHLGCAHQVCTKNNPFGNAGNWDYWVCDYSPPGNYIGQRPY
jgi:pathogenesis-related protein 1